MNRIFSLRLVTAAAAVALALSAGATGALANNPHVLTVAKLGDTSDCAAHATYNTIQSAVNAASAGDTIRVCPGTYQEYVFIPSTLNNLTIRGQGGEAGPHNASAPVILFPTTPNVQALTALHADSLVTVDGATGVNLVNLEISGPFTDTGCEGDTGNHSGVYVGTGGQANLGSDYVTKIQVADATLYGCQDGFGIAAGNSFFFSHAFAQDPGSVNVHDTIVDTYQKDGILIDGGSAAAASAVVDNRITGIGPTAVIASNGVELDDSSTGRIADNVITANQYTPVAYQASGILLYGPGANVSINDNRLAANDIGVYAFSPGSDLDINNNQVANDTTNPDSEGIQLDEVSGGMVDNNRVSGGAYGIDVFDGTTGSTVRNNRVSGVADVGILNQGATSDTPSTSFPFVGPSTGNFYLGNHAHGSGTFDCKDDTTGTGTAGTANTWRNNVGATSSPAGLCWPGQSEDE
ncbi:MAG TPA: right-handed parallel beta-helix repeat-containing protein [Chloroflexota bacterium]|jgi:parallel beta-helix repeat protein|nr:right-handed parallel beta-helix repeat-containing protein [Chloroflexota bacterium]